MSSPIIDSFIKTCKQHLSQCRTAVECIDVLMPEVKDIMAQSDAWLQESYLVSNLDNYSRNVVYLDKDNRLGLYVLVWQQGQWTPIHDHGTWGVVGVLEGTLHEQNFIRCDKQVVASNTGIELVKGGALLLSPGSITSFVPDPDHIHVTGNPGSERVVSLHLYGHAMAGFNIYNAESGTRQWCKAS